MIPVFAMSRLARVVAVALVALVLVGCNSKQTQSAANAKERVELQQYWNAAAPGVALLARELGVYQRPDFLFPSPMLFPLARREWKSSSRLASCRVWPPPSERFRPPTLPRPIVGSSVCCTARWTRCYARSLVGDRWGVSSQSCAARLRSGQRK